MKFPTIPIWSNRWTNLLEEGDMREDWISSFQLFRFEVIGELEASTADFMVRVRKFPTIPIWSNRWTGSNKLLEAEKANSVSNYSDLK